MAAGAQRGRSAEPFQQRIDADLNFSGLWRLPASAPADLPLIVAIPGGSYTAGYFDVDGASLFERAAVFGFPMIAFDRPGYRQTTPLAAGEAPIAGNAVRIDQALERLWRRSEFARSPGIVVIGHSIGAAVAVALAARRPQWPLLGLALSGLGLTVPAEVSGAWASLPDVPLVSLPPPAKDAFMFGPTSTYDAALAERTRAADAPTPRAELIDIVSGWPSSAAQLAREVGVPVHYRQAEFEKLWAVDQAEILRFAAALSASPRVDAAMFRGVGHCIDFHHRGAAFQLDQLAFAARCADNTR
jgi:pimeloyl-ACP methyl ester carboxylesterase